MDGSDSDDIDLGKADSVGDGSSAARLYLLPVLRVTRAAKHGILTVLETDADRRGPLVFDGPDIPGSTRVFRMPMYVAWVMVGRLVADDMGFVGGEEGGWGDVRYGSAYRDAIRA